VCGRFSQSESSERLARVFGAYPDDDLPEARYNVAPSLSVRVVLEDESHRRLTAAEWGLRPPWRERRAGSAPPINARAETAPDSPLFGPALHTRRCLIPADAFYEWDRAGGTRQPYAIGPSSAGAQLALAGIWNPSRTDVGRSMAILTTTPNELVERIHGRIPVIVAAHDWDRWLDISLDADVLHDVLAPVPADALRMWPVSTDVNYADREGPHLLDRVGPPPTLGLTGTHPV